MAAASKGNPKSPETSISRATNQSGHQRSRKQAQKPAHAQFVPLQESIRGFPASLGLTRPHRRSSVCIRV
jgi:hypothetical protein